MDRSADISLVARAITLLKYLQTGYLSADNYRDSI